MKGVGKGRGTACTDVMCITRGSNCMCEHFVLCCVWKECEMGGFDRHTASPHTPPSLFGMICRSKLFCIPLYLGLVLRCCIECFETLYQTGSIIIYFSFL